MIHAEPRNGPLSGIRVLDLSRVLAGPYCTMLLGDLGAEVIKIERPGSGDDTRHWGPPFDAGESAYFLCCNRNKKSVTLDFKSQEGQELIRALARQCDVLVENFLPGKLDEYGLGYDAIQRCNESLVYCSITGFGQTGPRRMQPGYDLLVQAMSGVMSITGEPGGQPVKVGVAIADITAGLFASNAILAALVNKARTGNGDRIDIALFDACLAWLANVGSSYLMNGELPARRGNAHPSIVPYQAFKASDDWFVVAVGNDRQFQRFCAALGRPDLATDSRYRTNSDRVKNREALIELLISEFLRADATHWLAALAEARVPAGPINRLDAVFADAQVSARNMRLDIPHPLCGSVAMVASPMNFASTPTAADYLPPPALGQHTDDVLHGVLGLSRRQLTDLARTGVI